MILKIGLRKTTKIKVMKRHKTELDVMACVTVFLSAGMLFAPKYCAVTTVRPPVKPKEISKKTKKIGEVAPSAARALIPSKRPTIKMSEML